MSTLVFWILPICFFGVALLYSMVGFGGGSSYLALLVLFDVPLLTVPPLALVCNIIVAGGGWIHFKKAGYFNLDKTLPFVVTSIPAAYWGGSHEISISHLSLILGACLFIVAARLALPEPEPKEVSKFIPPGELWIKGSCLGLFLGFLAGLVGIGGGIFLSPIIILMKWFSAKEAAATASFFILLNSISGLLGQMQKNVFDFHLILPLALVVLVGGQIGSRLGTSKIPSLMLKRILAALVSFVAVRLWVNVL